MIDRHPIIAQAVAACPRLVFCRRISNTRLQEYLGRQHGFCTWCNIAVPPGRARWCSQACLDEADIYMNDGVMARRIWERDGGLCVICSEPGFEVDHIVPVIHGGGLCLESNLRLLCRLHHTEATKNLHRQLIKEKQRLALEGAV